MNIRSERHERDQTAKEATYFNPITVGMPRNHIKRLRNAEMRERCQEKWDIPKFW